MKSIKPIKNPNKMKSYWLNEKCALILIILSGTFYNIGMVFGPLYQGKLIDSLVNEDHFNQTLFLAITFLIIILVVMTLRYIKRFYVRRFANNTNATMRLMIYNNIVYRQEKEIATDEIGTIMSKTIADVDACVEGMRKFTTEVFDTGVLLISYIISLMIYDWKLTLIALVFTFVAMFIAERLKTIIVSNVSKYRVAQSNLSSITYDYIDNAMLYRIFGRENDNVNKYSDSVSDYTNKAIKANFWETSMEPIYNAISMIGIIFVIIISYQNIQNNIWTIGTFTTYVAIFTAMSIKSSKASKLFNSVQKSKVSWDRIKPYLKEYEKLPESTFKYTNKYELTFNNVSFNYQNKETLFDNVNIDLKSGDFVGITGQVASGKSTLGKLLLKELDYKGDITINNTNIKDINCLDMSNLVSYLGHKPNLMSDTIEENIRLGKKGDIDKVIKTVCFDEDLKNLNDGLNTMVGFKGVKLSGGQQSRVALARTLYTDAPIFVLDDPFSDVDETTEINILNNLKENYADHIFLIISHRLKNFALLDSVILIDDKTVMVDNHDDLIKSSKLYASLVKLQYGGDTNE